VGPELDLVRMGRDEGPFTPSVAMFGNDDFVVSWTQHAAGGDTNVYARIFNSTGTPLTGIITVGGGTFKEHDPDVAVDTPGFVVAYTRDTNGNNPDVFAKRYDFSGRLLNVINVGITPKAESHPSIAHGAGGLVVAYQLQFSGSDDDILLSRFTLGGSALGTITVAGSTAPEQWPSLAIESDNNAVVAYQKFSSGDWDIKARRVSFPGTVGKEINIRNTSANETNPSVALKAGPAGPGGGAGSFVVAYNSFNQVKVTEISPFDAVLAHHDAGLAGSFSPAVSISLSGEYLMTYTFELGFPFGDRNILGRFGRLS
jgi:hypothetical protein